MKPTNPPTGSVIRLGPNASLINGSKIKEKHDFKSPLKIGEATVMIDENFKFEIIDPDEYSHLKRRKKRFSRYPLLSVWTPLEEDALFLNYEKLDFEEPQDRSLSEVMERFRQKHIDCNTVICDTTEKYFVYAHRSVLIVRSPYFYRYLHCQRRKIIGSCEFCKICLPIEIDSHSVEAVISYMYTGDLKYFRKADKSSIRELLLLFELKGDFNFSSEQIFKEERGDVNIKAECIDDRRTSVTVIPYDSSEEERGKTPILEVNEDEIGGCRKKRKRFTVRLKSNEDEHCRLKVSVQKIVNSGLDPFILKIEELFSPSSSTLQIAERSQHIITLWHADILLTKLFHQSDLTMFFSDLISEVNVKNNIRNQMETLPTHDSQAFSVESLFTQIDRSEVDGAYVCSHTDESYSFSTPDEPERTSAASILSPNHIPKYVHLIALYHYNIFLRKSQSKAVEKDCLMPSLLGDNILDGEAQSAAESDDFDESTGEDQQLLSQRLCVAQPSFHRVYIDLRKRVVTDLELFSNPSYHEELILHIIVDKIINKDVLPLSFGIFLAKGCNFCRKKECKIDDLTFPINSVNPICPDRECVKKKINCDICYKQMSNSKSLTRHKEIIHNFGNEEGTYICSHCGESFSKRWKLNIHERNHEDRKLELPCTYCKKILRGTLALRSHVSMVHETEPKYVCEYCQKAFKRKGTLHVHRMIHTGEKPFTCLHCSYATKTKGNLNEHIIRKHKLEYSSFKDDHHHDISQSPTKFTTANDVKVISATIVAQTLNDGSPFILT